MDKMNKKRKKIRIENKPKFIIFIVCVILLLTVVILAIVSNVNANKKQDSTKKSTTKASEVQTTKTTTTTQPVQTTKQSTTASTDTFVEAETITIDQNKWQLTLLNRSYKLPDSYVPKTEGLTLSLNDPRQTEKAKTQVLDYRVAKEYQKMYDAAAKDGIYLTPYSGYRSIEFQTQIFNNYITMYKNKGYSTEKAKYEASQTVLPPGTSEHNMGVAMDIVNTKTAFENSDEFKWLQNNAHNYGFILRYPKDKTDITKIIYEPWHWRYVGVDIAKEMKSSGKCLEEYLGKY